MRNLRFYFPGLLLIATAILILAVPEILIALLAASIIMVGIGALYIGHLIRTSEAEFQNLRGWYTGDSHNGRLCMRIPIFRSWYRKF